MLLHKVIMYKQICHVDSLILFLLLRGMFITYGILGLNIGLNA